MPKGGRSAKVKGDKGEREFCKLMGGDRTYWQPGNERTQGDTYDVPYLGRGEIKRRKHFKTLYGWLADNDFLAMRADQEKPGQPAPPWLVVMRAGDLKLLLNEMDELKRGAK